MKINNIYKNICKLIISLLIPQLAGGIGSIFTAGSVGTWYTTLEKPFLNPPDWVFGPVWTTLFFLMGYSLYLVWTSKISNKKPAYLIFSVQLALNVFWSVLFFGLHSPALALFEIFLLWFAIAANIFAFAKISRASAWLLAPYISWVSFAIYLNFSIWKLN